MSLDRHKQTILLKEFGGGTATGKNQALLPYITSELYKVTCYVPLTLFMLLVVCLCKVLEMEG